MPISRILVDAGIACRRVFRSGCVVFLLLPFTACVDEQSAGVDPRRDASATDPTDKTDGGEHGDARESGGDTVDVRGPIEPLTDSSAITVGDSSVADTEAHVPEAGLDAADSPCHERTGLELNAIELADVPPNERSVACYAGCGYVLGYTDDGDYQWSPNGDVHCPPLDQAECDGLRDELFGMPQPCETDDDCELWNPLSCENVAGLTNIPVSLLLTSEERKSQQQTLDEFTYGGCGNSYSTGFDGPVDVATCEENRCTTRENGWCGLAPDADGDALDAGNVGDAGDISADASFDSGR